MLRRWFQLGRSRRAVRIARGLMLLAGLLPFMVTFFEQLEVTRPLGALLRSLYGLQCHQRVARSFACSGATLPICARCLGIYLGIGLAALIGRPRLRVDAFKAWMLIGALLVAVDVASEWVQLRPAHAEFRLFVGALLAYGTSLAILESLRPRRG